MKETEVLIYAMENSCARSRFGFRISVFPAPVLVRKSKFPELIIGENQ
jgi:hypothetical protein